mmetsp:Transcript_74370/g.112061  ORF Transcript_74370/g.112061 Transcript_74370/m.112061 type:complete len:83 (+) Transcript_74370:560-808(+)
MGSEEAPLGGDEGSMQSVYDGTHEVPQSQPVRQAPVPYFPILHNSGDIRALDHRWCNDWAESGFVNAHSNNTIADGRLGSRM